MGKYFLIPVAYVVIVITLTVARVSYLCVNMAYQVQIEKDAVYLASERREREKKKVETFSDGMAQMDIKQEEIQETKVSEDKKVSRNLTIKKGVVYTPHTSV